MLTHKHRADIERRAHEIPDWAIPVDQYQEHLDHEAGCASDLQNAYAHSRAEHRTGMEEVNALVAQGLHVVVSSGPAYCRTTDAVIGTSYMVCSSHLSRRVADRVCARLAAEDMGEIGFEVFPRPAQPARAPERADLWDDEIPF